MPGERITIGGGRTKLVVEVGDDGRLHQQFLGDPAVPDPDLGFPISLYPLVYPTFGEELLREPALRVTHADGSPSTRLVFAGASQELHEGGVVHRVAMVDRVHPLHVDLCWRTWPAYDLVEQWVEVANGADGPVTLHQAASAAPGVAGTEPWFTHWGGGWAREWTETTEHLTPGTKTVASAGGVRAALHRPPIALLAGAGRATETEGAVLAVTVVWGGDTRFDAELAGMEQARLIAGVQHRGTERTLEPGERFTTPAAVLVWSGHGTGHTSRALHRWAREQRVRDGERERAIVFNNWETMFFDLATETVNAVVDGAASLGAELFLLDDGWFGSSDPRDDDRQGLGDWTVDGNKFPDGLTPVIEHVLGTGMRFGLWVEPEMVNPTSDLYRQHPDWVIAEPGRERREERNQLVLDLLRPEVRDFVLGVIDGVLAQHPGITYLKWDANRDVFEAGSQALAGDRQSHLAIDRVHATNEVMAEVARRHPDVELMACASGGGRSNLETLQWFHELWTSDNTDPVDRVRIQWGASHLLPASVLGAHVTRWGAKPVAFGCAVALSGRFGFDIDPRSMSPDERTTAAGATETYRRIRPLVQAGDLHRLVSPVDGPVSALAYLSPDGDGRAVVFAYRLEEDPSHRPEELRVPGLEPGAAYRVETVTPGSPASGEARTFTGADLAAGALAWPVAPAPSAEVYLISREG